MAKLSRSTIQPIVKASDLKKAIVEKNKKLSESILILKDEIKNLKVDKKQADKDLVSVRADCEEIFNEMDSAKVELDAVIDATAIAKKELSKMKSNKSKAFSASNKAKKDMESSEGEFNKLTSKINKLKEKEEEYKSKSLDLKSLKTDLEDYSKDITKLKASKSRFKKLTDDSAKKCNEMVSQNNKAKKDLEDANALLKAELEVIDKDLLMAKGQSKKEKEALQGSLNDKNLELDKIDTIMFKSEKEYAALENKISIAKNNILEEESRLETIKENFEGWKITAVEEVARMKLRGRIENIDKAGLKDVLSR